MALRRSELDRPERLVLLRDVLAELSQVDPTRILDAEAEGLARTLQAKMVTRDWASRLMVPERDAERLLLSLRRDRLQHATEQAERIATIEQEAALQFPPGTIAAERPGEPLWTAPGVDLRQLRGPLVTGPG